MVERDIHFLGEGRDQKSLRIAFHKNYATSEQHLRAGHIKVARKIIRFRFCT
jgi:hypothetical protein